MTHIDNVASVEQLDQQIDLLIERRRYSNAATLLAEGLAQYPDNPDLLYQSARLDWLTDQPDEACNTLQQVLTHAPKHFGARAMMFQLHEDRQELAEAENMLLDLLHDYPESAWLHAKYALLMYRTAQIAKAQALAQEALRLDPDSDDALVAYMLGKLIDGDHAAGKNALSELMRKHPESLSTAHMLITYLTQHGKYAAAKRIAIEILHLQPDSRETLELVVELEHVSHWSMLPLWPLNRWGWAASGAMYVVWIVILSLLRKHAPTTAVFATIGFVTYVIYSWAYPPLLKRWLMRRAGL